MKFLLLLSVFVIATCGLIYELIAGALASYLLGDSITQFSTIIGTYLFAMGVGSYLSKYIDRKLFEVFIVVELLIGLVGGYSATILFLGFEYLAYFRVALYGIVFLTGLFVGLEIPLLMRILEKNYSFKDLVSNIFTFDYIGALIASLLFPLFLVPYLGLIRSALLFGILNVFVGVLAIYVFREHLKNRRALTQTAILALLFLGAGFYHSKRISNFVDQAHYDQSIIYSKDTPYQKIVLTHYKQNLRLFLNGNLQFSSDDEYRYHESIVHVGLSRLTEPKSILILGGGDGLAAREVLKYASIESITLVDLDPSMTELFQKNPILTQLNQNSLNSPRIKIVNADAFLWMRENRKKFDFIIVDFPDPSNFSVGKLYSTRFYQTLMEALANNGLLVVQSTSPYVAKKSFWCIAHTLNAVGFYTFPYQVHVPTFGSWGFVLASKQPVLDSKVQLPSDDLKFITTQLLPTLFVFPKDLSEVPTEINRLQNQVLVRYFEREWS